MTARQHAPDCAGRNGVHDPAEWRLEYTPIELHNRAVLDHWTVYGSYGSVIASTGHPSPYMAANARLIAAAPDMLEALKQAEQQIDYGQIDAAHRIIIAAIAKAEGRS